MNIQLSVVVSGLVGFLGATGTLAQTAPSANDDGWHFVMTPYLWMAGLNGNTRIGPLAEQNVDAPFSDVVGNLSAAFMGLFEARKDRWVILLDTFYVGLSQSSGPRRRVSRRGKRKLIRGCWRGLSLCKPRRPPQLVSESPFAQRTDTQ